MNSRIFILLVACFICSLLACKNGKQEKQDVIDEVSMLDSIRLVVKEKYNEGAQQNEEIPTSTNPSLGDCTPCDMSFLVYLSDKEDYDLNDIKTLLCLDDNDICDDNAEFVPFYNEMVFKVFNREREDLSFSQIDSLLQDHELIEELENPMSETNSRSLIMKLRSKN